MIEYKIIKKLGYGTKAQVFLIESENKFYALKIEKLNSLYFWREINFYKNFGFKYPNHFYQLIDYKIENTTAKKIYTLVDTTLDQIIHQLDKFKIYSIIIQIVYSVFLLHSNGYVHGDLRGPNIGIINTKEIYIDILGYKIPTYGLQIQLIDFGSIGEKEEAFKLNDISWYEKKLESELVKLTNIFVDRSNIYPIERYCKKHKINLSNLSNPDIHTNQDIWIEKYLNTKEYYYKLIGKNIKSKFIPRLLIDKKDIIDYIRLSIKPLELIDYFYNKYFN